MLGVTHEVYAIISNTIIKEFVATDYASATEIATTKYGSDAFATDVTHHPVQVGDEYVDGEFRRTNEDGSASIIYYVPTPLQDIASLKGTTIDLQSSTSELESAVDSILTEVIPSIMGA